MKPSPTDISLKYLKGLSEEVRKKNASKLGKSAPRESVEPDGMGVEPEMGDEDISAILEGGGSGEHEMGDEFPGDGKDVGSENASPADDKDQSTIGKDPRGLSFKKKPSPFR